MRIIIMLFTIIGLSFSCTDTSIPLPKPRIYPKVEYPVKDFQSFESNSCPFTMTIPKYFEFVMDKNKIASEEIFNCWFDLICTELNTNLHMSYVPIKNRNNFDELVQDAFEMADKHNVKASYREEIKVNFPSKNVSGLIFNIDGPVASPTQFFLTDSTSHFVRGSLYFNDIVNRDSIAPIYEYLSSDIGKMIETFEWK